MPSKRQLSSHLRPVVLAMLLSASGLALADATTDQAKALIEQRQSQAAYDLLLPLEPQRAGDETYDLLLGIAANDVGRFTNAVLALERVLAVNPNNARARAEIARAYFGLGEVKTARQEFDRAKAQGVPPEVAVTIDHFLSAVNRIEDATKPTVRAYVEGSGGWDSNVNAGPSGSLIAVPGFGGAILTLNDSGQQAESTYTGVAGGVNLRVPIDPRLALTAGMWAAKRMNTDWDQFDTGNWDGNVGLTMTEEQDVYSVSLQAGTFYVDNDRYRDSSGISAQWQHNYDQRNQATVFLQLANQVYPLNAQNYDNEPRNADRWTLGAGYAYATRDAKWIIYGSGYYGEENAYDQPTSQLDQHFYGVRAGTQYQYNDALSFFAGATFENRAYQGEDPFYLKKRDDDTWGASVGATYNVTKDWKVTPQYQYIDNRSNFSVNRYTREVASVTVRYEF